MQEFTEITVFKAQSIFQVLPKEFSSPIMNATPNVSNVKTFICQNSAPITVTNFLFGAPNQPISLLGDGFTTIANNSNIVTNTGADKLLAANKVYRFTLINNIWYEDA